MISFSGKPKTGELIKNVQCGYDVRKDQYVSIISKFFVQKAIWVKFCKSYKINPYDT